jgi:hypothetical protein
MVDGGRGVSEESVYASSCRCRGAAEQPQAYHYYPTLLPPGRHRYR